MTRLTNKQRLPPSIVAAISNDSYTKAGADYSVTELLGPPQIARLKTAHAADLEEDAADRIWALLGQAVHAIIERAAIPLADVLAETTFLTTFEDKTIKATFDSLTISEGELNDFKVTTVWKVTNDPLPDEWVKQTNIYRWMLKREKGVVVNSIAVIAIFRDWAKREADKRPDYPQSQALRIDIPLMDDDEVEALVRQRIALHSDPTIGCSDEDIWAKPSKWALMQKGRKTAVRLFDNAEDANAAVSLSSQYVEHRPGVATRCESYCPVSNFCPQWATDPRRKAPTETENLFS